MFSILYQDFVLVIAIYGIANIVCITKQFFVVKVCTPHFKYDTEDPYVTQGSSGIHCWFNPDKTKTLILLAYCIKYHFEDEDYKKIEQSSCPSSCFCYSGVTVINMQIKGNKYNRRAMCIKTTSEYLRDGESFNIKISFGSTEPCVIL